MSFDTVCLLSEFFVNLAMFRNQYDSDVTIWSPQGRLHQVKSLKAQLIEIKMLQTKHLLKVEYAMEAVKQGSATVGVKSNTHAVLVALKRASSELSRYVIGKVDKYLACFHSTPLPVIRRRSLPSTTMLACPSPDSPLMPEQSLGGCATSASSRFPQKESNVFQFNV